MPVCAAKITPQKSGNHITAGKEDVGVFVAGEESIQAKDTRQQGYNEKHKGDVKVPKARPVGI